METITSTGRTVMLRDAGASNLPPPNLLEALRRPRRPQLGDPCVKALLAEWKKLQFPIEYVDLWKVAATMGVKDPDAKTRRKIVAAVEAAGIEIYNYDDLRQSAADTRIHISLTPEAMVGLVEESRWRRPEEWDSRPRTPAEPPPRWLKEFALDQEYGPTAERYSARVRALQGGPLWFLSKERPS
jgi:hypothetical protein